MKNKKRIAIFLFKIIDLNNNNSIRHIFEHKKYIHSRTK